MRYTFFVLFYLFFYLFCLFSLFLLLDLLHVELELLALEDVAVSAADLTRAGCDASKKLTSLELLLECRVDLVEFLSPVVLGDERLAGTCSLLFLRLGLLGLLLLGRLGLLDGRGLSDELLVELNTVVLQEPLTEGSGIDLDDRVAHQSVCADKLVVRRVVDHVEDTSARGDSLGGPCKVAGLETERTTLDEPVSAADKTHDLGTDTCHGRLAADLEFPFLAESFALAASCTMLVDRVTSDTYKK